MDGLLSGLHTETIICYTSFLERRPTESEVCVVGGGEGILHSKQAPAL